MRRLACMALLVPAFLQNPQPAMGSEPRPNILLIVIESLRADHVGCYGYRRDTTPALDALAASGARFERAIAASSWTMPSVMTIMTGVNPAVHGAVNSDRRLRDGLRTLAAEFAEAGYQTAGIISNPLLHGKFGFSRGFGHYDDFTIIYDMGSVLLDEGEPLPIQRRLTGERTTRLAANWLRRRDRERPFFLFVFYFDPHYDYVPPPPYGRMFTDPDYAGLQDGTGITALETKAVPAEDRRHIEALYDGDVRHTDEQVGRLLALLSEEGPNEATVVMATADHGEEFWDHGGVAHGHTLYDELVRVPLLVRFPPRIRPGSVIGGQASHADLMPTLLDLAGLPTPREIEGASLLPVLEKIDAARLARAPAVLASEARGRLFGMSTARSKIIEHDGVIELYDIEADPRELRDLAGTAREGEFSKLRDEYSAWKSTWSRGRNDHKTEAPAIDERLLRQLRSLGYGR